MEILEDAILAAIAAIGFASISNTPWSAIKYCALLAAIGHSFRFVLINIINLNIIIASAGASFIIGALAIIIAPRVRCAPETFSYPSLLPMIPGMYAYRTFQGLVMCLSLKQQPLFDHYFYLMSYNGLTCLFIVLSLVIGVTIPIFIFKRASFSATK